MPEQDGHDRGGRKKEAGITGTYGRPRPYEREGPASAALREGRAVEDSEGFQATWDFPAAPALRITR